jgi:hypothetical protein
MSLPLSLGCCIQLEWDEKVKTSFGGSPPKEVCSLLDLSTVSWLAMMAYVSLGKVFDGLRFL